jgi:O-antigen/teichoic acid export membrane protein
MKAFKDSAGVFITQFLNISASFFIGVITARILGPDGKGIFVLAFILPGMFIAFGNLGLGQALVYNLSKNPGRRDEVITSFFVVYVAIASVLTLIANSFLTTISEIFIPGVSINILRVGLVTLPTLLWIQTARECFRGTSQYWLYNLAGFLSKFILLLFLLVLLLPLRQGIIQAIYANILTNFIVAALCLIGIYIYVLDKPFKFSVAFTWPLISYGWRVHPGYIMQTLENRIDFLLLSHYMVDPTSVGLYSLAVTLAELLLNVPEAVGTVWLQRVSKSSATDIISKTMGLSRVVLLISSLAGILMAFTAYPAIYIVYGPKFLPSYSPFLILLFGIIARAPDRVIGSYIQGIGRPGLISLISLVPLIVNLGLNILLIPEYGINGAALSSLISYTIRSLLTLIVFSKLHRLPLADCILVRRSDWIALQGIVTAVLNRSTYSNVSG